MKPQFNKTWLLIVLVIIGNIAIFYFMSQKLENFVTEKVIVSNVDTSNQNK